MVLRDNTRTHAALAKTDSHLFGILEEKTCVFSFFFFSSLHSKTSWSEWVYRSPGSETEPSDRRSSRQIALRRGGQENMA